MFQICFSFAIYYSGEIKPKICTEILYWHVLLAKKGCRMYVQLNSFDALQASACYLKERWFIKVSSSGYYTKKIIEKMGSCNHPCRQNP